MPNIGLPELIVILVIVLLFFGPKKMPDFARSMGQAIREFRRASQEIMDDFHHAATEEPAKPVRSEASYAEAAAAVAVVSEPEAAPEPTPTKQL